MNEIAPALPGNSSAKPSPERRVRHGLIEDWRDAVGILILLLVAAFFGALIARFWPETDDGGGGRQAADTSARLSAIEARLAKPPREITDLKDRVAKLETRVQNAETTLAAATVGGNLAGLNLAPHTPGTGPTLGSALSQLGSPAAPDATKKLVEDMGTRLAALETKTATTPADVQAAKDAINELSTHIATFSERLGKLENSDLLALARRASLATAIANLTRAAQGSSPFKPEFDVVAAMMPNEPGLAAIEPSARKGLPTTGTLIATFGNAADAAIDAERVANGEGMWTRLWANFMSLISSRAVGETPGNSSESRLARAELRMKSGDLDAAVKEMSAITGPARALLAPWLAPASARVKVETTLADLNTRAIAALAGPTASDSAEPVPQLPAP